MTEEQKRVVIKLRKLAKELRTDTLRRKDIQKAGFIYEMDIAFGGKITPALEAAGLKPSKLGKAMSTTEEELLQHILDLLVKLGKLPTIIDLRREGKFSDRIYESRFNSFPEARVKALAKIKLLFPHSKVEFSEIIQGISNQFSIIYNQALTAEESGLNEICGAGYRRALEFLLKDYLIKQQPKDRSKIEDMFLGEVIKMVKNANIQACAKRATWLGNDETHYQRKWINKELSNLKELIGLTVNWIEQVERTKKYQEDMPDKKDRKSTPKPKKGMRKT